MSEFTEALRYLADVIDDPTTGEMPEELEPLVTETQLADAPVFVTVRDGDIVSIEASHQWMYPIPDDELARLLAQAINVALDEHEAAFAARYMESGGIPNGPSVLYQAASYASSALMMELEGR